MKIIMFTVCLFLCSCAQLSKYFGKGDEDELQYPVNYSYHSKNDFIDHLVSLGNYYIENPDTKILKLSGNSINYLTSIHARLINNNELFFTERCSPHFYVIRSKTPFFFSLPKCHFFLSTTLVKKYVRHENILASILAYESVKSFKNIYNKGIVFPIGNVSVEQVLSLTKIDVEDKIEINKWAYYVLKRSGYDANTYLNWLRIQNKNTLDFALQHGNIKNTVVEEFQFKNFMVKNGFITDKSKDFKNSSQSFYKFIKEIDKTET